MYFLIILVGYSDCWVNLHYLGVPIYNNIIIIVIVDHRSLDRFVTEYILFYDNGKCRLQRTKHEPLTPLAVILFTILKTNELSPNHPRKSKSRSIIMPLLHYAPYGYIWTKNRFEIISTCSIKESNRIIST